MIRVLGLLVVAGCGRIAFEPLADSLLPLPSELRVAAQGHHTCALRQDGALYCWGRNDTGQLGIGDITDHTPMRVPGEWVDMYLGEWNTCARDRSGALWCWGRNDRGTLGDGASFDELMPARAALTMDMLAIGEAHGCGIRDGKVYCWGAQSCGRVVPGLDDPSIALPTEVTGLPRIVSLATHDTATCGIGADQRVYCWGNWDAGPAGSGYSACGTPFASSIEVVAIGQPVVELHGGCHGHICARTEIGALYCWGANTSGQIGINNMNTAFSAQNVSTLPAAMSLSLGAFTTCAQTTSGLYCWGDNTNGTFGNGTQSSTDTLAPVHVATLDGRQIESLALGCYHACAILDGQLNCWGENVHLAAGGTTMTDFVTPTPITLP